MSGWPVPRGYFIKCASGHVVAITQRDINQGDMPHPDQLMFVDGRTQPTVGQVIEPACKQCGALWVYETGFGLQFRKEPSNEA